MYKIIYQEKDIQRQTNGDGSPRWLRKSASTAAKLVSWFHKHEENISRYYIEQTIEITMDELVNAQWSEY